MSSNQKKIFHVTAHCRDPLDSYQWLELWLWAPRLRLIVSVTIRKAFRSVRILNIASPYFYSFSKCVRIERCMSLESSCDKKLGKIYFNQILKSLTFNFTLNTHSFLFVLEDGGFDRTLKYGLLLLIFWWPVLSTQRDYLTSASQSSIRFSPFSSGAHTSSLHKRNNNSLFASFLVNTITFLQVLCGTYFFTKSQCFDLTWFHWVFTECSHL